MSTLTGLTAVRVTDRRFGARGDGVTDDTSAIQSAIDWMAGQGGGEVIVPNGAYMIKGHVENPPVNVLGDEGGIALKDNVHLFLAPGATLRAIPNDKPSYVIVRIYNKQNVTISGGTIQGERHHHTGTAGEWGYGIAITGGRNITITDVTTRDCWGDGVNLQALPAASGRAADVAENVRLYRLTSTGNRRQGMSVEGVIGLVVEDSTFEHTGGKAPQAGVDIEPWRDSHPTEDMIFSRCIFRHNAAWGMIAMMPQMRGLTVENCIFEGNQSGQAQLEVWSANKGYRIANNVFRDTPADAEAIWVSAGGDVTVEGNTADAGVRITTMPGGDSVTDVRVAGNIIRIPDQERVALYLRNTLHGDVYRNTIDGGSVGVRLAGSGIVDVDRNTIRGSQKGISVSRDWADRSCTDITATGNRLLDNGIVAAELSTTDWFTFQGNTVWGAAWDNHGADTVFLGRDVAGVRVIGNLFHQEPHGPVEGKVRSRRVLSTDHAPDTITTGNHLVGEGYTLGDRKTPAA